MVVQRRSNRKNIFTLLEQAMTALLPAHASSAMRKELIKSLSKLRTGAH